LRVQMIIEIAVIHTTPWWVSRMRVQVPIKKPAGKDKNIIRHTMEYIEETRRFKLEYR
jgi:hypothetical protein